MADDTVTWANQVFSGVLQRSVSRYCEAAMKQRAKTQQFRVIVALGVLSGMAESSSTLGSRAREAHGCTAPVLRSPQGG